MPSKQDEHFDKYTAQNRAKHEILVRYLKPYLTALKSQATQFHYIDGFAGKGRYEERFDGSPLLALQTLADVGVIDRSAISLVEERVDNFADLQSVLLSSPFIGRLAFTPLILHGEFAAHLPLILNHPIYRQGGSVATFAFVDPCGIKGLRLNDIASILKKSYGEALLFFNCDGVNRVAGGIEQGTDSECTLIDSFGSAEAVAILMNRLRSAECPEDRESIICDGFIEALRMQTGVKYFARFRVEAAKKDRVSHYLVHCSSHCLAFRLMKDAMEHVGRDETEEYGKLEFQNDRERGKQFSLFDPPDVTIQKQAICDHVQIQPCRVAEFTKGWTCRPDDKFSEAAYRQMLRELEKDGLLTIFDKSNKHPLPSDKRMRKGSNAPTMGDILWVRASTGRKSDLLF